MLCWDNSLSNVVKVEHTVDKFILVVAGLFHWVSIMWYESGLAVGGLAVSLHEWSSSLGLDCISERYYVCRGFEMALMLPLTPINHPTPSFADVSDDYETVKCHSATGPDDCLWFTHVWISWHLKGWRKLWKVLSCLGLAGLVTEYLSTTLEQWHMILVSIRKPQPVHTS